MSQVIVFRRAEGALKRMPEHYKRRILGLLLTFRENPVPAENYDIKKLKGYVDTYRARIWDIRIICEIVWRSKRVHALLIERRERAYH